LVENEISPLLPLLEKIFFNALELQGNNWMVS